MPATTNYLYSTDSYVTTIECADCHVERSIQGRVAVYDETVAETFRWHSGNGRYLNRCRSCERTHVRNWRAARSVPAAAVEVVAPLGADRTFGVELELTFPLATSRYLVQDALAAAGLGTWRVKTDGSLSGGSGRHGLEIVSPILSGENGYDQIARACGVLQRLGAKPNRTCGMHVHHGVSDLGIEDFKRLVASWTDNQGVIDRLVSASRRHGGSSYCRRLTSAERQRIMALRDLRSISYHTVDRYRTLNVQAYTRYGTVEIRQHQGTVEADKIVNWVKFGQAIIDRSRAQAIPRTRTVADLLGQLSTLAESARTFLAQREVQLAGAAA